MKSTPNTPNKPPMVGPGSHRPVKLSKRNPLGQPRVVPELLCAVPIPKNGLKPCGCAKVGSPGNTKESRRIVRIVSLDKGALLRKFRIRLAI